MLAACGRSPEARADTNRTDSTRCDVPVDVGAEPQGDVRRDSLTADSAAKRDTSSASAAKRDISSDSAAAPDTSRRASTPRDTSKDSTATDSASLPKTPPIEVRVASGRSKKVSLALVAAVRVGRSTRGWPVHAPVFRCSILPQKRIVAFYGNPLSKKMGILGELPPDKMLAKLDTVTALWRKADSTTPVEPALHYIAVVASGDPGKDGKWRARMDSARIEEVYSWAQKRHAILFLDIQTGQSTVQAELPRLMKFLERPDVHLGIDPEFHMHYTQEGVPPGKKIGTLTAKEVNWAISQLANLVTEKKLPPKVLIVHRFTRPMLKGADQIKLDPRVQVVINMDGWGAPWLKFDSYKEYVAREPVQFTGFKLFFHNDTKKGDKLLTPLEVLQLKPAPLYIQYQ